MIFTTHEYVLILRKIVTNAAKLSLSMKKKKIIAIFNFFFERSRVYCDTLVCNAIIKAMIMHLKSLDLKNLKSEKGNEVSAFVKILEEFFE